MKPMLADDFVETKLVFPLLAQPKIDGVRALNMTGTLTGRSLKTHKNRHVTAFFSHSALLGLDGEMAAEHHCHPDLCRITSSALSTIEGSPFVLWWLFDYVTAQTRELPYEQRFHLMLDQIRRVAVEHPHLQPHLRQIPCFRVESLEELLALESKWLEEGYEGVILRDPNAPHKEGRSGKKPLLWRIKRFIDFEGKVVEVVEGESNQNEAKLNELGLTERSTHQENMIPNGMVGNLRLELVADVVVSGKVLPAGDIVTVGAGRLTHDERKFYFENQDQILGRIAKAKLFPKGIKDKPRFPTFQSFRDAADMGGE